jgi:Ca-activated chloride channel family protein
MASRDRSVAASSTGGTAEPNDAPVGDMFFRQTGVNPFIDTSEDKLSTFALDVDTGSWSLARAYLEGGALPPPEAIRVEEFVNAQEYDDPPPRRGDFALIAEGAPSPFAASSDYRVLRFAVKGREIDASDRKPAVLTFVVDVSGSMAREDRLGLVKQALGLLLDELREEDRVALVVYGSSGHVLLEHTSDHERIRDAIDSLRPEGSTNAEEGLRLGYDLADRGFRRGWNNRVVLCSDGVANVGATGPESILARIGSEARRGIELTTVGFGMGNYNDALMEQLADQGDGRYHYVDTVEEAERIFLANLAGTLETIAKDAKVQVEFDPSVVERWRLLGYENRDVADRDFRNDRIDAGEIGAGHGATAVYEIRLAPRARRDDTIGVLRLRWASIASGRVEETELTLRLRDLDPSFDEASANLRRAAVSAELAEILKHSFYAKEASWTTLREEAARLDRALDSRQSNDTLLAMVEGAAKLSAARLEDDDR